MREEKSIDIYHWHNLSLSYISQFGSLELNLHFKHDFKNTLLWFPRKRNTRLLWGKAALCAGNRLSAKVHRSCWSQRRARRGTGLAEPLLITGCSLFSHCPGADTSCLSQLKSDFSGSLKENLFFIYSALIYSCSKIVQLPLCGQTPKLALSSTTSPLAPAVTAHLGAQKARNGSVNLP